MKKLILLVGLLMTVSLGYSQTLTHGAKVKLGNTPLETTGTNTILATDAAGVISDSGLDISDVTSADELQDYATDSFTGTRAELTDSALYGFMVDKSVNNGKVGYSALNTNVGTVAIAGFEARSSTNLYTEFAGLFHYGANYTISYLQDKGALSSDDQWLFLAGNTGGFKFKSGSDIATLGNADWLTDVFTIEGSGEILAPKVTPAEIDAAAVSVLTTKEWVNAQGFGAGDVTKVGTPVNNELAVWTGDGTVEGEANLIYNGTDLDINGNGGIDERVSALEEKINTDNQTLSASEINNLGTTPIEIIPNPGAGTYIKIISIDVWVDYTAAAPDSNVINITATGATNEQITIPGAVMSSTSDTNQVYYNNGKAGTLLENVSIRAEGTDSVGIGDTTIQLITTYQIITK